MREARVGRAIRSQDESAATLRAADWLSLAAAPAFALMALLATASGGGHPDVLCVTGRHAWTLGGMVPMYLLMSAFHSAPWLGLISRHKKRVAKCPFYLAGIPRK
jgi:hypothetical protein